MCLMVFLWQPGADSALVLAANRDEFHDRPASPARWWSWPDGPLAGRDERAGGTWLAVGRDGRFAAVTNYRDPDAPAGRESRGRLPVEFIRGSDTLADFVRHAHARRGDFSPFNLIAGGRSEAWYTGTHSAPRAIEPGIHALSNHLLDTPWPKTERCRAALRDMLADGDMPDVPALLRMLDDRRRAPDKELPDTGIGLEAERALSAPLIVTPRYGTRASYVVLLGQTSRMLLERSLDPEGNVVGEISFSW